MMAHRGMLGTSSIGALAKLDLVNVVALAAEKFRDVAM
jgi:hypothetical protein